MKRERLFSRMKSRRSTRKRTLFGKRLTINMKRKKKVRTSYEEIKKLKTLKIVYGVNLLTMSDDSLLMTKFSSHEGSRFSESLGLPNPDPGPRTAHIPAYYTLTVPADFLLTPEEKVHIVISKSQYADHLNIPRRRNAVEWPDWSSANHLSKMVFWPFSESWQILLTFFITLSFLVLGYNLSFQKRNFVVPVQESANGWPILYIYHGFMCTDFGLSVLHGRIKGLKYLRVYPPLTVIELVILFLSAFPFRIFGFILHDEFELVSRRYTYLFQINYLFAVYRLWKAFGTFKSLMDYGALYICYVCILTITCLLAAISLIMFEMDCFADSVCGDTAVMSIVNGALSVKREFDYYIFQWYYITRTFLHHGATGLKIGGSMVSVCFYIITWSILYGYFLPWLIRALHRTQYHFIVFKVRMQQTMRILRIWNTCNSTEVYENMIELWKRHLGEDEFVGLELLSPYYRNQVTYHIFKQALAHTCTMSKTDQTLVRELSLFMKTEFRAPGDVVMRRNEMRAKYIYVVSGQLQIMSTLNERVPLMWLNPGSSIGESSLYYSDRSNITITCATFCQLQVLQKTDFLYLMRFYRKFFKRMAIDYRSRAKNLKKEINFKKMSGAKYRNNFVHIFTGYETKCLSPALLNKINTFTLGAVHRTSLFRRHLGQPSHVAQHSREYVVSRVVRGDPILMMEKFPWRMRPKNHVVLAWNVIICAISLINCAIIVYYFTFSESYPEFLFYFGLLIQAINLIDIYFTLSLGIRVERNGEIKYGIFNVMKKGFFTLTWWLDFLSVFPFYLIQFVMPPYLPMNIHNLTHANQLLKLHKLKYLLKEFFEFNLNVISVTILKYIIYFVVGLYLVVVVNFLFACYPIECKPNTWYTAPEFGPVSETKSGWDKMVRIISYSVKLVVGQSAWGVIPIGKQDVLLAAIIDCLSLAFRFAVIAVFSSTFIAATEIECDVQEFIKCWSKLMARLSLDREVLERSKKWSGSLWLNERSRWRSKNWTHLQKLGSLNKEEIAYIRFASILQPVFRELHEEVISRLATLATTDIIPPNELIAWSGKYVTNLMFLVNGVCQVFLNGELTKYADSGDMICGIEFFLGLPAVCTYITIGYCEVMYIADKDYKTILEEYPGFETSIFMASRTYLGRPAGKLVMKLAKKQESASRDPNHVDPALSILKPAEQAPSCVSYYNCSNRPGDGTKNAFSEPFKSLGFFSFNRFFLLRVGLNPNGDFMFVWECFRVLLILSSTIYIPMLHMARHCFDYGDHFMFYIVINALNFFDVYLKLHVGYYDERGMLVVHPKLTAEHYVTNSFIYDLLFAFPLELFLAVDAPTERYLLLTDNRLGQLFRLKNTMKWAKNRFPKHALFIELLSYLCVFVPLTNAVGAHLVFLHCDFNRSFERSEHFEKCISCDPEWTKVVQDSTNSFPVTPFRLYAYAWYSGASIITQNSLYYFYPVSTIDKALGIFVLILGMFAILTYLARFISDYYNEEKAYILHTQQKRELKRFLYFCSVKKHHFETALRYTNLWWRSSNCMSLRQMLEPFSECFREEMNRKLFVSKLRMNDFLENADDRLLLDLAENSEWSVFIPHFTVVRYNDVLDSVYVVVGGRAEARGDHGFLMDVLTPGSMFGNMRESESGYKKVNTDVASTSEVLQVLTIKTSTFYKKISLHDKGIYERMKKHSTTHKTYFKSSLSHEKKRDIWQKYNRTGSASEFPLHLKACKLDMADLTFGRWKRSSWGMKLFLAAVPWAYLINCWYTLYSVFLNPSLGLADAIASSLFYVINFAAVVLKLRLGVIYGAAHLGATKGDIMKRYLASMRGFLPDLVSLMPFNLVPFYLNAPHLKNWFRLNTLFTMIHVDTFFKRKLKDDVAGGMLERVGFPIVLTLTFLHLFSVITTRLFIKEPSSITSHAILDKYISNFEVSVKTMLEIGSSTGDKLETTGYTISYALYAVVCPFLLAYLLSRIVTVLFIGTCLLVPDFYHKYSYLKMQMDKHCLDPGLINRVTEYLKFLWRTNEGVHVPDYFLKLPASLRTDIYDDRYRKIIRQHILFRDCGEEFLRGMVGCVEPVSGFPGDVMVGRGQRHGALYWLERGSLLVVDNRSHRHSLSIELLTPGNYFGTLQGMFPEMPYFFDYKALTMTQLLSLEYRRWAHILKSFPGERKAIYERLANIKINV